MSLATNISLCTQVSTDRKKTIKDPKGMSKSMYLIDNPNSRKFGKVDFDGCVFNNENEKCDYGLELYTLDNERNEFVETIHYIELKGSDSRKGFKQLLSTIEASSRHYSISSKKARLVVSKVATPDILDNKVMKKLARVTGETLNGKNKRFTRTCKQFTEKIS